MSYRLGRKEDGKTRPLRIILDSKAQRKVLIENAKHIPKKTQEKFQRVIIAKDLIPGQRKERREKIKSIKAKKQQKEQEQPASPMDARAVTPPTHQLIMRGPGIPSSDTMPSPIRNVETSIQHRLHLNAVNDSSLESQAYNQTTIVSSTNIDDTVLGGLTQHGTNGYTQAPFEPR